MTQFLKKEAVKTHKRYLEKPMIVEELKVHGYTATDSLVKNIRKLREKPDGRDQE